ncbi:MAG TPA: penicillin-binding protein 2 [Longimicrobiaceae bacterium]|nr:penicillin-binding protein 2 [Longimicrobiaceae bacterium]
MRLFHPDPRERRLMGALFVITFVVSILLTAFFQTQVVRGEQFAVRSEENRLRPVVIPAPRGTILDRYGEIIATSIPGFSLTLLPGEAETVESTLRDLSPFLGLADVDIERLMATRARRPHDLLTVTEDATYAQVAAIEERRSSFPNLLVVDRPKRFYPEGEAIGHIIGYVSEVTREQLQLPRFREAGYRQGRWIGQAGIESQYELTLSGSDGARFVEVDAMGRIVNPRATVGVLAPTPGRDLQTTLDIGLQRYIAEVFPDTMKGSVVAMVPSTGEVLAMYSNPSFDPNDFVGGIASSLWSALQTDPNLPLFDRAMAATYPPASTFKTLTATLGVEQGVVTAESRMPISCSGGLAYAGRYARCWLSSGHGSLNLAQALEKSCNVYFYQLGIQLGLNRLMDYGTRVGFGRVTGIDLPNERSGTYPRGAEWWRDRFGYAPQPSEVMSVAIGQGPNDQTMLRMAHFYSAVAGNGTAPEPYLVVTENAGEGEGSIDLGVSAQGLEAIWRGLEMVIQPGGTAWLSSLVNWQIYGKTGTAQNPHGPDHGLFMGFSGAPGGNPEITVAAVVEHGLHGSDVSPLVAKVINYYLSTKHGIPVDLQPTLLERYMSGRTLWGTYDQFPAPLVPKSREVATPPAQRAG